MQSTTTQSLLTKLLISGNTSNKIVKSITKSISSSSTSSLLLHSNKNANCFLRSNYHHQSTDSSQQVAAAATINPTTTTTEIPSACPYHNKVKEQTKTIKSFDEIPGPKGLPILGNLVDFAIKSGSKNVGPYFLSLLEDYGEIVKVNLLGKKFVILGNPEYMAELYQKEEKRLISESTRKYKLERGISLSPLEMYYEENWYDVRQIYNMALKPEFQSQITIPQLSELNGDFLRSIAKNLGKTNTDENTYQLLNTDRVISRYGFDSVLKVFLGVKMSDEITKTFPFEIEDLVKYSVESQDILVKFLVKPPYYHYFKTAEYKRMEYTYDKSFEYARYLIERFKVNPTGKQRFFELLTARSQGQESAEDKVDSILIAFIQAAIDITYRKICFCLFRLAHHPEYQERIYNELNQVFGEPTPDEFYSENGLSVTMEQFKQLKFTQNFLEEVFRMHPFSFSTSARKLHNDIELAGYHVPKDTHVVGFQRYPNTKDHYVPRALEFIPERHEKGSELAMKHKFVSTIFGVGARTCPGSRIAKSEIILSLVNVVRHFKLSHENPEKFPETSYDKGLLYIDLDKNPLYLTPRHEYLKEELKK